jgi:hypothetical protein
MRDAGDDAAASDYESKAAAMASARKDAK